MEYTFGLIKFSWNIPGCILISLFYFVSFNWKLIMQFPWDWAEFTLLDLVPHPLWFAHLTPLLLLHMDAFLRAFLGNSICSSNPPHIPPCSHIVCNMHGPWSSLWLGILYSGDIVTSCSPPNKPGISLCILSFLHCYFLVCLFFKASWPNTTVSFNSEHFIPWKTSLLIPKLQAETFLPWVSFLCVHMVTLSIPLIIVY